MASLADAVQGTQNSSFTRLLALWKLRASQADVASALRCPATISPGVFCLRGSGNLAKLRALGRPAVLRLNAASRDLWVVLLGADGSRVRLGVDGDTVDVALEDFEQHWLGEYFAVWRAPAFLSGITLRRGDTGPGVEWLRQQLVEGGHASLDLTGPAVFDAQLESGVRALQNATGLVPDGIVGQETLLAVTGIGKDGPRLRRRLD